MNIFKHRNFSLGCALFLCVLLLSNKISLGIKILIALLAFVLISVFLVLFLITKRPIFKRVFINYFASALLVIVAVLLSIFVIDKAFEKKYLCDLQEHTIVGKVDEVVRKTEYSGKYTLDVATVDGENNKFKVPLNDELGKLNENDIICARVVFASYDTLYLDNGITFGAHVIEYISIEVGKLDFIDYFRHVNRFFDGLFKSSLNDDTYSLMSAMFLGNRKSLKPDMERDFARIGISHILSLSGMHVSIVIAIFGFFIDKLRIRRILKIAFITLLILFFVLLTGFNETAIRAGFMQFLFFLFFFIREMPDSISCLFGSVFIICLANPFAVFSFSLTLSFLAMLGCICSLAFMKRYKGYFKARTRFGRFCILTLLTTIFVSVITMPLIAIKFRQFSIFAFPSNLLITPVLNILIYLAPLMLLVSKIPVLSSIVAFICEIITFVCTWVCKQLSSLEFSVASISKSSQYIAVAIMFIAICIYLCLSKKQIRVAIFTFLGGLLMLVIVTISIFVTRNNNGYIYAYSTGKNDTVFIESNNSLTVIEASSYPVSYMVPNIEMRLLGYTEIESYIACDYNYKTVSYLDSLTDTNIVRSVYLQKPVGEQELIWHNEAVSMLKGKGINIKYIEKKMDFEGFEIDFSDSTYVPRSTNRSVALSILMENTRYTYLGASSYEVLDYFASDYANSSDVVVFGSYGPTYQITYDYELNALDGYVFLGSSKDFASSNILSKIEACSDMTNTRLRVPH